MRTHSFRNLLCATILAVGSFPGLATAQEDKALARVNGVIITEKDLSLAMEELGASMPRGMDDAQKRKNAINFLIDLQLGARAAEAAKIAETPEFSRRMTYMRNKLLMDEFVMREATKNATPEAARQLYEETIKKIEPEPEVRARHVLVETEEEAKKIHERLSTGKEDFAKIAAEVSKDPGSKTDGGDLGWFSKGRMVEKFADAAFKLNVGQISEPVQTQFGWHVIRVEEKRMKEPPSFESVKAEIDNYLVRQSQQNVVLGLRKTAKVEILDKPPADKPAEPKKP